MACKATNPEELKSLVQNKKAIFDIRESQSAADTINYLKYTTENFIKEDGKYKIKDSNIALSTTITTRISEWYEKNMPYQRTAEFEKLLKLKGEAGNAIHSTIESIVKDLVSQLEVLDVADAVKQVLKVNLDLEGLKKNKYGFKFDDAVLTTLSTGVRAMLRDIYIKQRDINNRTGRNDSVAILSEQVLIDAKNDIGGTADLIAIFSNNTAAVYDFKTKLNVKNKKGQNRLVTMGDKERYKLQLAQISKILRSRYGIKQVILGRIVPIKLRSNKENVFTSINMFDENIKLNQLLLLPEKTGFQKLDEYLSSIEKDILKLKAKIKEDRVRRPEYEAKIEKLEKIKLDILVYNNFNTLISYIKETLDGLTLEKVGNMKVGELKEVIDELEYLATLSESTYAYRQNLRKRGIAEEHIMEFETDVSIAVGALSDKIDSLKDILYGEHIASMIEQNVGIKIVDDEGNFIPFNDEGYLGKYFNQLSEFDNPVFKTLRKKLDSIQYDIREDVKKVIEDVQAKEDALYKWMKTNGKDQKWLIDILIDKTTDNLVSIRSNELQEKLWKMRADKNGVEISKHYEPTEYYKQWYDKAKAKLLTVEEIKEFELRYDLSFRDTGAPKSAGAWVNALYSGRLTLKKDVEQANLSDNYKQLKEIPELFEYYNMFVEYNKKFRQMLGVDYHSIPDTFVPNIRKSAVDRMLEYGMVDGLTSTMKNFLQNFDVREDDMEFGELEDGAVKRTIPRFFMNPFRDKDGNTILGEKSYDLGKSLVLFSKMAYNYKHMAQEEAEILALKEFFAEKGQEVIRRKGKVVEDYLGNKLAINIKDTDLIDIFNSFVDTYLYGIHIQPKLGDKTGTWEKRIMLAKQYFTLKSLGMNWIAASGSFLAAKINTAVEGNKGIIYTSKDYKEALNDMVRNREKFLAINAFFDPMEIRYNNFNITAEKKLGQKQVGDPTERNFIKKYVTTRTLLRPFSYGDETIDELIVASMAKNYYVDESGNLKRFLNDEQKEKYKNRSVWNLFQYENDTAKLNIEPEQLKNVIISFRRAVQAGQSRIKGVIPEEDKAYWQSQIFGQIVMQFKSWMPGIMKERFGALKYNDALQSVYMGRYPAFGYEIQNIDQLAAIDYATKILLPKLGEFAQRLLLFNKSKFNDVERRKEIFERWLDENPHYKGKITFEEFLDVQQKQVKAMIAELRILLTFFAIMLLLGQDWDDDGEKDYKQYLITRKLASIIFKTNQELSFTYNPLEFSKMIANPIPMIGLVTSAWKTIANTFDETRDLVIGENSKNDKTGFGYYTHQWIPGASGISKLFDVFREDSGEAYK